MTEKITSQPDFDNENLPQYMKDRVDVVNASLTHEISEADHRQDLVTRSSLMIELC